MWKRCGRFWAVLLLCLLVSSLAFSEGLNPLEAGVREWAADKDKEQVVEKLIAAVLKVESLETRFATVEEKLKLAEEKQASSLMSFEESLRLKNQEIAAATRRLWTARSKWGLGGLAAGTVAAILWTATR
jgi:hypothetical protein